MLSNLNKLRTHAHTHTHTHSCHTSVVIHVCIDAVIAIVSHCENIFIANYLHAEFGVNQAVIVIHTKLSMQIVCYKNILTVRHNSYDSIDAYMDDYRSVITLPSVNTAGEYKCGYRLAS